MPPLPRRRLAVEGSVVWRISRRRPQSLAEREQRKHAHQHRDQVRLGRGCGTGKSRCRHCSMVCPVLLPTAARRGDTGAKKRPDLSPILPYRKIWFGKGGKGDRFWAVFRISGPEASVCHRHLLYIAVASPQGRFAMCRSLTTAAKFLFYQTTGQDLINLGPVGSTVLIWEGK